MNTDGNVADGFFRLCVNHYAGPWYLMSLKWTCCHIFQNILFTCTNAAVSQEPPTCKTWLSTDKQLFFNGGKNNTKIIEANGHTVCFPDSLFFSVQSVQLILQFKMTSASHQLTDASDTASQPQRNSLGSSFSSFLLLVRLCLSTGTCLFWRQSWIQVWRINTEISTECEITFTFNSKHKKRNDLIHCLWKYFHFPLTVYIQ